MTDNNINIELLEHLIDKKYEQEKSIVEYPRMGAVKDLYHRLKESKNINKIKEITYEVDEYLKRGIGWNIKSLGVDDKEVDTMLKMFSDYNRAKRKLVFPKYDSSFLDKYLLQINRSLDRLVKSVNKPHHCFVQYDIKKYLLNIKEVLDNPHIVGLYEETQFSSLSKEINWELSLIKKKSKREFIFSEDWFPEIKEEISMCFKNKVNPSKNIDDTILFESDEDSLRMT